MLLPTTTLVHYWSPAFLLLLLMSTAVFNCGGVTADGDDDKGGGGGNKDGGGGGVSVSISKDNTGLPAARSYMVDPVSEITSLQMKVAIFMAVQMGLTAALVLAANHVYKVRQEEYYKRIFKLNGLVIRHYEAKYGPLFDE